MWEIVDVQPNFLAASFIQSIVCLCLRFIGNGIGMDGDTSDALLHHWPANKQSHLNWKSGTGIIPVVFFLKFSKSHNQ
jgi:hypothetical protein